MINRKFSLLLLSILLVCGSLALLFYQGKGEAFSPAQAKIRVLRGKDNTKLKPTAGEVEAFRNVSSKVSAKGQEPTSPQPKPKRQLDDRIPKHVPIKIKIKKEKEKEFQDRDDEQWIRYFELEVKNTGDKPIYFFTLVFSLPEVKAPDGNEYGFSLSFGRSDLVAFSEPIKPDDISLKPGETYVFKLSDMNTLGWEGFSGTYRKGMPQPQIVQIMLSIMNFGDGSGYQGPTGVVRRVPKKQSRSRFPDLAG